MQLFLRFRALLTLLLVPLGIANGTGPTSVEAIEHVRQFSFEHQSVQVMVRGVVTEAPGRLPADPRFFHIQDQGAGIAVLPPGRLDLKLGDCMDVIGTTTLFNDLEPQLDAPSVVISSSACDTPRTREFSIGEVKAGRGSGALVRVAGRVVDSSVGDDRALIFIGDAKSPLRIVLRRPGDDLSEIRRKAEAGALVEIVGVSLPSADGKSYYLRLRRCADIVQKAPPPFHPHPALLWLVAVLTGLGVATGAWIVTLRRAVSATTREISLLLERARAASKFKSQFLANMSHEIRTPIHGILGMQEIVLQSTLQPEQRESLEIAHATTRFLLSLLNDILDLSKIEADSMELSLETLSLRELMSDLERQFRASALLSGVTFEVRVERDVPEFVSCDPVRLRQVLANLLSNAFKFTSEGSVVLSCTLAGSEADLARVRFAVQDTGIGISDSEQEKVFAAFHQAVRSITRRFGGTGLGLTISSRLVSLMRGDLDCESKEGEGSAFSFELDLQVAQRAAPVSPPAHNGLPTGPLRILLAEDNPINQLIVRRPLEALGHQVVVCEDGEQATTQCALVEFDVVLMDVQMPILDGLEAARRIRERESQLRSARVPILALTANSLREQVDECFAAGMDACLCKPFLTADLLRLIAVHARSQAAPSKAPPGA